MKHAIPIEAKHRLADLLSDQASNESLTTTARWFAELVIDKFLSDLAKERLTAEKFSKLSLGESIDEIKGDFNSKLIEALQLIKSLGDKASHYKKGQTLTPGEAKSAVRKALQLFHLVLLDELIKVPLNATSNRATIFSTLMPAVREHVLKELLNKSEVNSEYQKFLIHKYILACVKNNNTKKAIKFLEDQANKSIITKDEYAFELATIDAIKSGVDSKKLPIAKNLSDARRNLTEVLGTLSEDEKTADARLISIVERLLEEVEPSEMGECIGHANFIV